MGIVYIADGALSKTLVEINIDKCPNVTLQSSLVIAEKLPNIKIFNCGFLGDDGKLDSVLNKMMAQGKQIFWTL